VGNQARLKQERRAARAEGKPAAVEAAKRRGAEAEQGAAEGMRRGCLFCRQSDGGFTSVEHVFPESLGNKEVILPVGVVCDRCNHQVLSPLDAALCDFGPIAMMRTIYGVESKSGKRPSFKFDNGSLHSDRPGNVQLSLDSEKWHKTGLPAPPGHTSFSFTGMRHDATPRRLSKLHRALTKIALECAWLDLDEESVLSGEFDRERRIVLGGGHHGYLILAKQSIPEERQVTFTPVFARRDEDGEPYLGIAANILGVLMATDTLKERPAEDVPEDVASVHYF